MKYLIFFLACTACGGGLSDESKTDIKHAAEDSAAAYQRELATSGDAGSPAGALIRGAHCAVQGVIRNEKLPAVDSGVPCQ